MGKITKAERKAATKVVMLAAGTWFMISSLKEWLNFSQTTTFILGIVIILIALWLFDVK